MRKRKERPFATEADLCAAFIEHLPKGWTAYAETAGWDILLVRDVDGFQIGVQAKLRMNLDVVNQAIEQSYYRCDVGPDCRAVLVPEGREGLGTVAEYLGLVIIVYRPGLDLRFNSAFLPTLPEIDSRWRSEEWPEWCPVRRHDLPEYVPDVRAGSSAPVQLTAWKIRAIKVAVLLDVRGEVWRADFKALKLDPRRWLTVENSWLLVDRGRYVRGPNLPDFKAMHPVVYEKIKADFAKWAPPEAPVQRNLSVGG